MGYNAAPLEKLIEEFGKFPGIGRKGATRMAYQVFSMSDEDAAALASAIQNAHTKLHRCRICQNYTEAEICPICASAKRDDVGHLRGGNAAGVCRRFVATTTRTSSRRRRTTTTRVVVVVRRATYDDVRRRARDVRRTYDGRYRFGYGLRVRYGTGKVTVTVGT